MPRTLDFYFDYSSPYGYLGSTQIEALAKKHQRVVSWQPILLGAIFKINGQAPLTSIPLKGDYALMDFARSARETNIQFQQPSTFPIGAVAASRATYWLSEHADSQLSNKTAAFVHALFKAYYQDNLDISQTAVVLNAAEAVGITRAELETALASQAVKDRLRVAVESAVSCGVFGSPMILVDDEPFWGHDRLPQIDRWLTCGGW